MDDDHLTFGRLQYVPPDPLDERLDDLGELGAYWLKCRAAGRRPEAIRALMLILAEELVALMAMKGDPDSPAVRAARAYITNPDSTCKPAARPFGEQSQGNPS